MKRMWSKEELDAIAEAAGGMTPEDVNGIIDDYFSENFENIMSGWLSDHSSDIDSIVAAYLSENPPQFSLYRSFYEFYFGAGTGFSSAKISIVYYTKSAVGADISEVRNAITSSINELSTPANGTITIDETQYPVIGIVYHNGYYCYYLNGSSVVRIALTSTPVLQERYKVSVT